MKKLLISAAITCFLSGCSTSNSVETMSQSSLSASQANDAKHGNLRPMPIDSNMSHLQANAKFQSQYKSQSIHSNHSQVGNNKNINHYVRGIMQDLVSNLQYVNASTPMAVSSFVFLDSNYLQADLLGNQISEAFLHEIHKLGVPVVDFKATDYMRVTPQGDFVLSKDFLELSGDLPIRYTLTGTLVKHQKGILVNARIVGLKSKAIVATAQGFIPEHINQDLQMSSHNDGLPVASQR